MDSMLTFGLKRKMGKMGEYTYWFIYVNNDITEWELHI